MCTCNKNSVLNDDGVCELQYRTDLWIIFQVINGRYSDQPEIVAALMEKFATFATVADFAPMVPSPTGGQYQLSILVSLRKVFKNVIQKYYCKTHKNRQKKNDA